MFFIIQVDGCLPYISIMISEEGGPIVFDTKAEAVEYAKDNCAWDFRIVEFK